MLLSTRYNTYILPPVVGLRVIQSMGLNSSATSRKRRWQIACHSLSISLHWTVGRDLDMSWVDSGVPPHCPLALIVTLPVMSEQTGTQLDTGNGTTHRRFMLCALPEWTRAPRRGAWLLAPSSLAPFLPPLDHNSGPGHVQELPGPSSQNNMKTRAGFTRGRPRCSGDCKR